tara:strand:- start:43 stop:393 length:351 start_codon:yes stop_codon:yes gene_type:complete
MAFKFNPFTGNFTVDTTNDGLAASYASQAASSASNAATSETNAATSETNAAASYTDTLATQDFAASLFFKANATAYNINTNTDFGSVAASATFEDEVSHTLLSMVLGSSSFDYGSV